MTHDELMALPEQDTEIGYRIELRHGREVRVPVMPNLGALFHGPEDGVFTDDNGVRWFVGHDNGVRVRRRMR